MTHYYLDTSALVKRYVTETGTIWITTLYKDLTNNCHLSEHRILNLFALPLESNAKNFHDVLMYDK